MNHQQAHSRPGAAAVAAILALVLLQLAVVIAVVAGVRDQDLSVHRVSGTRAFYASEAGLQMGVRETFLAADLDGDGTIGSISDDGDAANNPRLDSAALVVSRGNDGVMTSLGTSSDSSRRQVARAMLGGNSLSRRVVYCPWPGQVPQVRFWDEASWSPPQDTVPVGGKQYQFAIAECPTRDELIYACATGSGIHAAVGGPATWGNVVVATPDQPRRDTRMFSIAYEQISGRGLLVYAAGSSPNLCYRVWDGVSWSAQSSTGTLLSDGLKYVKAVARPGSDEIVVSATDEDGGLSVLVWNGAAFTSKVKLEAGVSNKSYECFDLAWESGTGRCLVLWGAGAATIPRMSIWDGSAWSAPGNLPSLGGYVRWLRLAPEPGGNRLLMAVLDANSELKAAHWNGATWGGYSTLESSVPMTTSRCFDVCFESSGGSALLLYARSSSSTPAYRVWNGSSWSGPASGPSSGKDPFLIQLTADRASSEIFALLCNTSWSELIAARWTGTGFQDRQVLEDNVNGGNEGEVFAVTTATRSSAGKSVVGWAEIDPH